LVRINKTRGDIMGYNVKDAALMSAYQRQFPGADLNKLAALAGIPAADVPMYTINKTATPARNAAFGQVTSKAETQAQVQSASPLTGINPITGRTYSQTPVPPVVESSNTSPNINPITGRTFVPTPTPRPTTTDTTPNINPITGREFVATPTPRPVPEDSDVDFTDAYGENFRQATPIPTPVVQPQDDDVDFTDAYGESFREVTPIPPTTRRPGVEQATLPPGSRGSGEFLDNRNATPQPDPFPAPPPARPVQPQAEVDDFSGTSITPVDDFSGPSRNISQVDDFSGYPAPTQVDDFAEINTPTQVDDFAEYSPPAQVDDFAEFSAPAQVDDFADYQPPAQVDDFAEFSAPAQVDDFSGYSNNDFGAQVDDFGDVSAPAQVDDFSGYSNNNFGQVDDFAEINTPAQVDDFSGYSNNNFGQVDDFAEINTPAQVDDFSGYSNNDFGTEDPGLDAFGPGPTPPAATNTEYDQTQFDPFGDVVEETAPVQVDDFADYSNNDFGAQVDDFSEINTPAQVDDFADYSNNDFGAQVDDFSEINTPAQVDDFADYSDNDFGEEDFSDFATTNSPSDVNEFGVDDFGDTEAAQFDEFGDPIPAADELVESNEPIVAEFDEFGDPIDPQVTTAEFDEFGNPIDADGNRTDIVENDGESLVGDDPTGEIDDLDGVDGVEQAAISEAQQSAIQAQALKAKAQQQQTVSEMREASGVKNADGDWRVKLRLAPQATYLYQAPEPGILAPLTETDGIIFPYTPSIDIQYRADYQAYSPTHSNYQHFFYQGSNVATVQINADFTAQDTVEAEYLLAVIHFLKSASKMFYGNDAQRGSPPPLLYLSGLGEYQFNESPCVISEFNYNLPPDVNYIRARSKQIQRDGQLQYKKPLATSVTNGNFSSLSRLKTAVTNSLNGGPEPMQVGAEPTKLAPGTLGTKGATYVPTKATITLVLNPIVSRQQVSQQFSLKEYANGNLIKKGMW
jgi:hypothetical protein